MALLDGQARSADAVADERVVCYGFSVGALNQLGRAHPNLIATILGNMMRDLSERLRRANDEVRASSSDEQEAWRAAGPIATERSALRNRHLRWGVKVTA